MIDLELNSVIGPSHVCNAELKIFVCHEYWLYRVLLSVFSWDQPRYKCLLLRYCSFNQTIKNSCRRFFIFLTLFFLFLILYSISERCGNGWLKWQTFVIIATAPSLCLFCSYVSTLVARKLSNVTEFVVNFKRFPQIFYKSLQSSTIDATAKFFWYKINKCRKF